MPAAVVVGVPPAWEDATPVVAAPNVSSPHRPLVREQKMPAALVVVPPHKPLVREQKLPVAAATVATRKKLVREEAVPLGGAPAALPGLPELQELRQFGLWLA